MLIFWKIVFSQIGPLVIELRGKDASEKGPQYVAINRYALYYLYIAIGAFVMHYVARLGFVYTGDRVAERLKQQYFRAALSQNMAVFDSLGPGDMATQLSSGIASIQDAVSQKLAMTVSAVGTLVATFALSFGLDWKLALMTLWSIVFAVVLFKGGNAITRRYSSKSGASNSAGSEIAEEALGTMKSVISSSLQHYVLDQYEVHLSAAERNGFLLKSFSGSIVGLAVGTGYLNMALVFWQGARFLVERRDSVIDVITVALATKTAAFSVFGVGSNVDAFVAALSSASRIFAIVARKSSIDPFSTSGQEPSLAKGFVELRNVRHAYPSRVDTQVLQDVCLKFEPGPPTFIVGFSGSGKSTLTHLIDRFYDPMGGQILFDGVDVRDINVKWLRSTIRVVGQEPVLFDTTIAENIAFGLTSVEMESCGDEQKKGLIVTAAKDACADDFIMSLPDQYTTTVGTRGSQLSGGQKQRIAIARALIGRPRVLILDEATSALDSETEARVIQAIRVSGAKRTILMISHRLNSITPFDRVVVMDRAQVAEHGTHSNLLASGGLYAKLRQTSADGDDGNKLQRDARPTFEDQEGLTDASRQAKLGSKHAETTTQVTSSAESRSTASLIGFVASLNKQEGYLILLGLLASMVAGLEEPASAVILGLAVSAVVAPIVPTSDIRSEANFCALMFLVLGLVQAFVFVVQGFVYAYCAERLMHRARGRSLAAMLRQDMSFYDEKQHSSGALSAFLATETSHLAGISGATLGTFLIAVTTLVAAFVVGCAFGWKLALVCSAFIPLIVVCAFIGIRFASKHKQKTAELYNESTRYASEAIASIQTLASLGREQAASDWFNSRLKLAGQKSFKMNLKSSLLYAIVQSVLYGCMALAFWYGGHLLVKGEYTVFQFTVVFSAVLLGALSAGILFSYAPDLGKAKEAASSLMQLLSRKPDIETTIDPSDGLRLHGKVEFRNVSFAYPSRPDHLVLRNFSLVIQPGQNVSLVGETGCGKSTILALIERFYEPISGQILLDDVPLQDINVNAYRRNLGYVVQEPTLMDDSVRNNLLAGLSGQKSSDNNLRQACRKADVLDFIESLP